MPDRGVLADSDGPLDAEDLVIILGVDDFQINLFSRALEFFSDPKIGWLEKIEADTK